jgi:hypothetical protein
MVLKIPMTMVRAPIIRFTLVSRGTPRARRGMDVESIRVLVSEAVESVLVEWHGTHLLSWLILFVIDCLICEWSYIKNRN